MILKLIPDVKFVPSIDNDWATEDATIPLGVIEMMVGVEFPALGGLLPPPPPPPPHDASPKVSVARPDNIPALNIKSPIL